MQTVRTTITLPVHLHEELMYQALKNKTSFSNVVVDKLKFKTTYYKKSNMSVDKDIKETFAFFDSIAKMGRQIDAVKAVRESRDERTKHLLKFLK